MRGIGGAPSGLGWPSVRATGASGQGAISRIGPGLGWPSPSVELALPRVRRLPWRAAPAADPAGEVSVSRETAPPVHGDRFAIRQSEVAGSPGEGGGRSGQTEYPPLVARHGKPIDWQQSGATEMTSSQVKQSGPDDDLAEDLPDDAAAAAASEHFVIHGPVPEGQDGPMIAGSNSGAESAQAESEDAVTIPGARDTSADTPIARAAQAAMNARANSRPWPRPRSCRILTIANQKGGVGKTTSAVNLAASLAMHGSRVLVVDLDPQGNASTALDVEHRSGVPSIYNVLVDGLPLSDVVRPVQGFPLLRCAPATIDLAGAEIELVPLVARESRLSRAVAEYDASDLDYIFIDCPPSLGLLTVNALVAAPEVLIPIQCEYYALEGLEQLLRTVELVKSHLNQ